MKIRHLDNSFFLLTPAQAKKLSIENRLPRQGYEIKACPEKLKQTELLTSDGRHAGFSATEASKAP